MVDLDEVMENLITRDKIDTSRQESPLRQAEDAIVIDTTFFTLDEQVDEVIRIALSRML
jgi:cytidylate kinase